MLACSDLAMMLNSALANMSLWCTNPPGCRAKSCSHGVCLWLLPCAELCFGFLSSFCSSKTAESQTFPAGGAGLCGGDTSSFGGWVLTQFNAKANGSSIGELGHAHVMCLPNPNSSHRLCGVHLEALKSSQLKDAVVLSCCVRAHCETGGVVLLEQDFSQRRCRSFIVRIC